MKKRFGEKLQIQIICFLLGLVFISVLFQCHIYPNLTEIEIFDQAAYMQSARNISYV
ncbi:hypothetical protein K8T06_01240 [bacterium]|nr:hypothetical protein [bacterium]